MLFVSSSSQKVTMAALQAQYDPVLADVLSRNNTLVFIDVVIQQEPIGRIKLEL
jgi:hypothetical protein